MKQETEQALNEVINILGKLLENENAQVVREGTILLKTFDAMLMVSNEWSRVYAGVLDRARIEEERSLAGGSDPTLFPPLQPFNQGQLCNCGLSSKIDSVEGSPMFGKKICDMTCKESERKAQGDTAEYIKFLSDESDEEQTEAELNEAVEDISNFVDDQLGLTKPNQQASRSGEKDVGDGKKKFLDKQGTGEGGTETGPKSKTKIATIDNIKDLINERADEREEALDNERKKIKEAK